MSFADIKEKNERELAEELAAARASLHELRFKAREGQLKNVRAIRVIRQKIAHILTALRQKSAQAK